MNHIKEYFKKIFCFENTYVIIGISAFSIFLSLVRFMVTGRPLFLFLIRNLFLALVPLFFSYMLFMSGTGSRRKNSVIFFLWIIFFPNSFYLITDIIHFGKGRLSAPLWYDMIMLLSYSLTGLLCGVTSLQMIEEKFSGKFNRRTILLARWGFIYVSCFGIYLGRFLRWNSWDIFVNPFALLRDVAKTIFFAPEHLWVLEFTFLAGTLLNISYYIVRKKSYILLKKSESQRR